MLYSMLQVQGRAVWLVFGTCSNVVSLMPPTKSMAQLRAHPGTRPPGDGMTRLRRQYRRGNLSTQMASLTQLDKLRKMVGILLVNAVLRMMTGKLCMMKIQLDAWKAHYECLLKVEFEWDKELPVLRIKKKSPGPPSPDNHRCCERRHK